MMPFSPRAAKSAAAIPAAARVDLAALRLDKSAVRADLEVRLAPLFSALAPAVLFPAMRASAPGSERNAA